MTCSATWKLTKQTTTTTKCVSLSADGQTPWYLKVVWVVYELASVASILVTILYFALLFSGQ